MRPEELYFTINEMAGLMHENTAQALRKIADHVEKWEHSTAEIISLLREISDETDAQSLVCRLRDEL